MCTFRTFILISVCCSLSPSTISGHLGGFQFQAVINYAASNFVEHMFSCASAHVSVRYSPCSEWMRVFSCIRACQKSFKVAVSLDQQEHMVFYWPPFSPTLETSHLSHFRRQWTCLGLNHPTVRSHTWTSKRVLQGTQGTWTPSGRQELAETPA